MDTHEASWNIIIIIIIIIILISRNCRILELFVTCLSVIESTSYYMPLFILLSPIYPSNHIVGYEPMPGSMSLCEGTVEG